MKVYNTMSRKKEIFEPIEPGKVKMYVCGPTVYNLIHIGNARPYVVFDTVRRYLEFSGYEVQYVQNFTDIDDKIIKQAIEDNTTSDVVSKKYIQEAYTDADGLNVKRATKHPLVTEEVPEIIQMIQALIDNGSAYEANGSVYFDVPKYKDYGMLSGKNIEDFLVGARVEVDTNKKSPVDFILWKPAKEGEPWWDSPWGKGRPGWHIECSVMAKKYLGDTIDIHAGGEDLVFPHHENEIAQSVCANGAPFARYWLHNGFITIDNKKMSKSEGNFFTLREISEKYPYEVIRFFLLNGHYRSPINFSEELVHAAENGLNRIRNCYKSIMRLAKNARQAPLDDRERGLAENAAVFKRDFIRVMDDDFNTADAITAIYELVKFINININENSPETLVALCRDDLLAMADVLGMHLDTAKAASADTGEIESLLEQRKQARLSKDWALSDQLRDQLAEMGVVVEDKREGQVWSFK